MRITTVGKQVVKAGRQAKQLEAAGSNDPEVFARLRKIKLQEALGKAKGDWKEIKELVGICRSTF